MDSIEVDFVWICKVGVVMFVGKCFEVKVFIQLVYKFFDSPFINHELVKTRRTRILGTVFNFFS